EPMMLMAAGSTVMSSFVRLGSWAAAALMLGATSQARAQSTNLAPSWAPITVAIPWTSPSQMGGSPPEFADTQVVNEGAAFAKETRPRGALSWALHKDQMTDQPGAAIGEVTFEDGINLKAEALCDDFGLKFWFKTYRNRAPVRFAWEQQGKLTVVNFRVR